MWRWPWMLVSLNLNLLCSLLIGNGWIVGCPFNAYAENTSLGKTSEQEARYLLENSKRAYQDENYETAITQLKRYVDRYPGYPEYMEAKLLLGRSLMKFKKYEKAIPYLKDYLAITPAIHPEAINARLDLGNAYLKVNKPHAAYLVSLELEKLQTQQSSTRLQRVDGLLLKGQASLDSHQLKRAHLVLNSMEKETQEATELSEKGPVHDLKLKIKLYECRNLLNATQLNEQQVKDRYERHGLCLMEALNLYQSLFGFENTSLLEGSTQALKTALQYYTNWASHPPTPARLKSKPQSQRLKYTSELKDMLYGERKKRLTEAHSSLTLWRKTLKPKQEHYLESLISVIESSQQGKSL